MLATAQVCPGDPARVFALEEKRFGLSILEAEDPAVATNVQLTLSLLNKRNQVSLAFLSCMNRSRTNEKKKKKKKKKEGTRLFRRRESRF